MQAYIKEVRGIGFAGYDYLIVSSSDFCDYLFISEAHRNVLNQWGILFESCVTDNCMLRFLRRRFLNKGGLGIYFDGKLVLGGDFGPDISYKFLRLLGYCLVYVSSDIRRGFILLQGRSLELLGSFSSNSECLVTSDMKRAMSLLLEIDFRG